jgi:hypothetical protein
MNRRALLAALLTAPAAVSANAPRVRVAFFGNSHTFTHDVPGVFRSLCKSTGVIDPMVGSLTRPAANLLEIVEKEASLPEFAKAAPDGAPWDIIVVQEQSGHSSGGADNAKVMNEFQEGLIRIIDAARSTNPNLVVILYQTWPWHESEWATGQANLAVMGNSYEEMHRRMRNTNARAAAAAREHLKGSTVKVLVSPVGDFWVKVHKAHPEIDLHNPGDANHASPAGAWLAATTIVGTAFGKVVMEKVNHSVDVHYSVTGRILKVLINQPEIFHQAGKE